MNWSAAVMGGMLGYLIGGPLGALIGAFLGPQIYRWFLGISGEHPPFSPWNTHNVRHTQETFFTATFSVMGHIAKADGRVSGDEIAFAEAVMERIALTEGQRQQAVNLFRRGKENDFDLDDSLDQLRHECRHHTNLLRMFLEIQLQAAFADGVLDERERQILLHIVERIGFSRQEFERLIDFILASQRMNGHGHGEGYRPHSSPESSVQGCYEVLGIAPDSSDAEVKRAYRRLMSQHHPDKLVARGLPEEMMKLATEKTQTIKAAYERIKEVRGIR